jgi:hypothetical protein
MSRNKFRINHTFPSNNEFLVPSLLSPSPKYIALHHAQGAQEHFLRPGEKKSRKNSVCTAKIALLKLWPYLRMEQNKPAAPHDVYFRVSVSASF